MPYIGQRPSKGDENNFKILDDISSYTLTFDGSDSSVVSDANDTITSLTHRFVQGQRVTYNKGGGTAIAGLSDGVYFIIKEDHNTIKLATSENNASNGIAAPINGVGSGSSHTLNVAFDGVNTKFKATHTNGVKARITRSAQLVISINGVIQQPHDTATPSTGFGFDLDGTIVFSQAPVSTDEYWAHVLTNNNVTFDISNNDIDNFTGNGSTVSFNLSKTPPDNRNILVTIDGVIQYPNDPDGTERSYTVVENVLTFVTAPADGVEIQVRHIGFAGSTSGSGGVTSFYGRTGAVVLKNTDNIVFNDATASGDIQAANMTVTGDLTVQGTTTTLDTNLIDVDKIEVTTDGTNVAVAVTQNGSGDLIRLYDGSSQVVTVDDSGNVGIADTIFHIGDTDTKIRFPQNDKIQFETGGAQRMTIGASGNITITNQLRISDIIAHDGDNDTQIRFPSADTITFETAGSERVRIKSTGEVGIGTINPEKHLTIRTGSGDDGGILVKPNVSYANNQDRSYLIVGTKDGWSGATTNWGTYGFQHRIKSSGVGVGRVTIDTNTGEAFCVENGGNVGIGTEDPTEKLDVNGSARIRNDLDVGGKLGIGTDSPGSYSKLTVAAPGGAGVGESPIIEIKRTTTNGGGATSYGGINWTALDGHSVATIYAVGDGDDNGADILFKTTSDAASNTPYQAANKTRLRINSTGEVLIGNLLHTANSEATGTLIVDGGDSNIGGIQVHAGDGENVGDLAGISFSHGNSGTASRPKAAIALEKQNLTSGRGDLCFYVDGTNDDNKVSTTDERLRITSDGRVGIGTTNPTGAQKLHVYADSTGTGGIVQITQQGTGDAALDFQIRGEREYSLGIDNSDANKFKLSSTAGLGTDAILIATTGGNIGINSVDPGYTLSIISQNASGISLINDADFATAGVYLEGYRNAGTGIVGELHFNNRRNSADSNIRVTGDGNFTFDQNVGIGTNNPGSVFHTYSEGSVHVVLHESTGDNDSRLRIKAPSDKRSQLEFADDDADAGEIRYDHTDNFMAFYVNENTERIRITSDGHVGINTFTTTYNSIPIDLNVLSSEVVGSTEDDRAYSARFMTRNPTSYLNLDIYDRRWEDSQSHAWQGTEKRIEYNVNDDTNKRMWMSFFNPGSTTTDNVIRFGEQEDNEWMRIDNGMVGIGTNNPGTVPLYVRGANATALHLERSTAGNCGIRFKNNTSSMYAGLMTNGDGFAVDDDANLGDSPMFVVKRSDGFVGIGITNPTAKLQITGGGAYTVDNSGRSVHGIDIQGDSGDVNGNFGGAISFGVGDVGRSAIAALQDDDDADNTGLSFFVHTSNTGTADAVEKMRLDGDGILKLGSNVSTDYDNDLDTLIQLSSSDGPRITFVRTDTSNSGGNVLGQLKFNTLDQSNATCAAIHAHASQTHGEEANGSDIVFQTTKNGTLGSAMREVIRIDDSGALIFNGTSPTNNAPITMFSGGTNPVGGSALTGIESRFDNSNITQYGMSFDLHFRGATAINGNRAKGGARFDCEYQVTGTQNATSGSRTSGYGVNSSFHANNFLYQLYGGYFQSEMNGSDHAYNSSVWGVYGLAKGYQDGGSNKHCNIYGGQFLGYRGGDVNSGTCYGVYSKSLNQNQNGNTGTMVGVYGECELKASTTVSYAYAFKGVVDRDSGSVTHSYILHGSWDNTSNATNRYGVYITGSNDNYLAGALTITGDLNANSGTKQFRIPHPLVGLSTTKDLVHAAIEGPQVDLIYRGKTTLVAGISTVNLDTKSGMTEGTFVALNRDVQCFTTNETGWTNVKGSVTGNQLTIIAQENTCTDTISWMVIGERQDDSIKLAALTDADGKLILEPDQEIDDNIKYQPECEKNIYNEDPNIDPNFEE